ncbi:glycosyl transferase [Paracoccus sp. 11-3]|uniref:Peptide O-xylosyltransferase n=1 Tax=Paracoccus amoyensis TaxID=2760093 RepID=A0A926J5W4_9RHOB|nr:DUF5928 domain-containing protein [Paracoccus amoyensis]MBC9246652.1 glycosyl transferase [Paracoccus amoyensis]
MTRIAFILLAHKDPHGVIDQAERLTAAGDYVTIHYDQRASDEDYRQIRDALAANPAVAFAKRRYRCGWGEWSLVAASLAAVRHAEQRFPLATHFYMLSGDCMPIKSAEYTRMFLESDDCDYIEAVDFDEGNWIKTGLREERLIYRHWFNERTQTRAFYLSLKLQKRLRLTRPTPHGLQMMIGSQWWCLRRQTVEAVLALIDQRPDLIRFFRTTWIPDETFFQTLVMHLVPKTEVRRRSPTFLMFTDYGMPVTFYNDHYDLLLRQDYLFARKISPAALELRERLGAVWQASGVSFAISNEGPRLFRFLTERGRVGRRFAPRFWETDRGLQCENVIGLIVAKKWHVAKRLTARIRALTAIPTVDYLFNELNAELPDLGGIASSVAQRDRHRRALVKLLFEEFEAEQLIMCVDPSALPLISDFAGERSRARILFIDTDFGEKYLRGHMKRIGVAGDGTPDEVVERLLPIVRGDLQHEAERLRDMGFPHFEVISEQAGTAINAAAIARFLEVSDEIAQDLAATPHLFSD